MEEHPHRRERSQYTGESEGGDERRRNLHSDTFGRYQVVEGKRSEGSMNYFGGKVGIIPSVSKGVDG
ncbi:hypothetical protein AKJ37_04850 [candidate division MSBL1 archaeon SCGC-AAA259I09]|uniref:Uncharacterized protein n=1 Tax=candidate division MSBL1 archaeon SCGC-AAA259I09 TaxID=1698267 RepID=A0A133UR36_9EURY|nr:hypothetical protein AKJ37_04850 [candidate division MSBL1 archaeon SCGC-AAA259I09]